ncbi:hypothetical protein PNK_1541 [Candidatus Protochlamydia naegleriophila]|uniref:Uncharacterized protein n=1 Tax=Candidatus Protochlamydia naegleriophila TaxID=389348 RepID=A0A0U5JFI4_9BACT|nr:hypothetical protein [Candidatus Protochlamydia naegleriophila]CUI17151.1 hypothetical protein PNK_1541 [Candidatus Protochlamydia naegleriophila]
MTTMNSRRWYLIAYLLITSFFSPYLSGQEKLFVPFDDRSWQIGFQEYADEQSIVEMILKGEDILSWKELFTVQKFDGIGISASDFAKNLEEAFKEHLTNYQDLILNQFEPANLNIFESSFVLKEESKSKTQNIAYDEYNLGRVLKGQTAIYYVRYSAKDRETFEKNKQAWHDRFKQMYLAKEAHPDQQGQWFTFTDEGVFQGDKKLAYESNNRVVTNEEAGFSLSLPKEWLVEDQETQETNFDDQYPYTISLIFSDPHSDLYGGVAFHEKEARLTNELKALLRKRYVSLYKSHADKAKLVGKGQLQTVLGKRGIYLTITDQDEMGWIAFFEDQHNVYRLELWGPKKSYSFIKANFDKLIANFQMLEKSSRAQP